MKIWLIFNFYSFFRLCEKSSTFEMPSPANNDRRLQVEHALGANRSISVQCVYLFSQLSAVVRYNAICRRGDLHLRWLG